jgi:S1-C subfamily serine protease
MKRILLFLLVAMSFLPIKSMGQTSLVPTQNSTDYSSFTNVGKLQTWKLTGIAHNDVYTGLFFRIDVNTNQEGWFKFPKDCYISGIFGTYYPVGLKVNDKDYDLGKIYDYDKGNKGKGADILLIFPRIPAGVSSINYCLPNYIRWDNIPITDNPDPAEKTNWTDATLRAHWAHNKCLPIEGIYYFTNTTSKEWWGENKHTLAVIRDDYQYKLIYLRGLKSGVWQEGDVKAVFVPTATRGLYKATSWLMDKKINNEDFYLKFSDGFMSIYENTNNVTAEFLKLYPAVDENLESAPQYIPPTGVVSANQSASPTATGSGIFVSDKVVVTNHHVISGARKIDVIIKDGNNVSTYTAKVLSTDKTNDLALISIEDEKFAGIGTLPFAISIRTRDVGTSIFTMGYPMATYMGEEVKITDGIINSKTGYDGDIVTYQISAPIQPGSSGGPLFDKAGYLIGITNAGIREAQNVGYAIKGSYLCNLIESAPVTINIPETNTIENMELTEQVKQLSKYVVFIKVY